MDWQAAAIKAFWFVAETMGSGDRLHHSWRNGQAGSAEIADDYSNMSRAALTLFENTGHRPYLEKAIAWVRQLDQSFWRDDIGGYCMTPDSDTDQIVRVRTVLDGATPSANGTMMNVLARLFSHTGNKHYAERYSVLAQTFADDARRQPAAAATYFNGFDLILRALQVVIVGERNSPGIAAFREVLRRTNLVNKVVQQIAPNEQLYEGHPAFGKSQVDGKATLYVCVGQACSLPITDPEKLELQLKSRVVQMPSANAEAEQAGQDA
jgi:uncharacterized protein YyaL (SSP411 family)